MVTYVLTPAHAVAQHAETQSTVVLGRAIVQGLDIDGVLEGAVLNQRALGDGLILAGEAHGEAEVDLGVRVEACGAELDDVSHACEHN